MTKYQFLKILDSSLQKLSAAERSDILQDFEEHFSIGVKEGKTEEQISASLGSPYQIAKELVASHHIVKVETTATTGNMIRAVWAVIGLSFFNIVIVLGPFLTVLAVIIAGWISSIGFIASPFLLLVSVFIFPGTFELFDLFFTMVLTGLGLLIAIGMFYVTRILINVFVRYLKFNAKLVKGGLKHE